jgi:hypothetical protein
MIKIGILIFVVSFLVIIVLRMSLTDVQKSLIILEAHNHPDYPSNRAIISGICVLLVLLGLFLAVFGGLFLI